MKKRELVYEGKAKKVFATENPNLCIVSYKDDATAFNGEKRGTIVGKGSINNRVSNRLMELLEQNGIPTHLMRELNDRETLVRRVEIIPLEVIVRNIAAGSLAKRLGLEEGTPMSRPVIEFCYKRDDLGDPMVNDSHILAVGLATEEELAAIRNAALKINDCLVGFLAGVGLRLVDLKLEFGRAFSGDVILADEISPDTCRFWDMESGEKLDKDRFRRDMGGVEGAYQEVYRRILRE